MAAIGQLTGRITTLTIARVSYRLSRDATPARRGRRREPGDRRVSRQGGALREAVRLCRCGRARSDRDDRRRAGADADDADAGRDRLGARRRSPVGRARQGARHRDGQRHGADEMTAATQTEPQLRRVQCLDARGLHRMAYWEWPCTGGAGDRVLVCAHGISRQGRDFDTLARAMQDRYRVVCPDVVGRGESDRLVDPSGYVIPGYVADMVTLLARLDAQSVHWVGTSMGGLIGMGARGAAASRRSSGWSSTTSARRSIRPASPASPATSACPSPGRAKTRRPTTC